MIVCSCNVLSDRQIRDAVAEHEATPRTAGQVYRCLGCSPQCGRCARTIRSIIDTALGSTACGACPLECPAAHAAHDHNHDHQHPHSHDHAHPHGHAHDREAVLAEGHDHGHHGRSAHAHHARAHRDLTHHEHAHVPPTLHAHALPAE
ncbi:(2Fe-2S)-binding protein [Ancylobacter sp. 6x-1]|uniref:Bacterioferritin-associated ferredoxin n=1 Tax=Ancylobacter crimeensis TaxID=2579147 RepID=A0ABT0D931_9HYPH|nr:(2Fe-2S)-binding protein [Ancylobacter crimeensis]MCK0196434.1 (2Fe-2S)-binding protein [Ancylobacter crimeensis]